MRRGYNQDIRAEAITAHYQGKEWKEILATINKKYGVSPSIRQMQKWVENYQGTSEDPTGVRHLAQVIEDTANRAQPLAQAKMMVDVMPHWIQLHEQYDLSPSDAGLVAMWFFFENCNDRETIDRTYSAYKKLRDKIKWQSGSSSPQA